MMGNFARLLRGAPQSADLEDAATRDAPPERFVEKVEDEGGAVFLAPVLEALRETLRARRTRGADASSPAPKAATPPPGTADEP